MPYAPFSATCEYCGGEFTTRRKTQRFCGHPCASAATRPARIPSMQRVPRDRALLHRLYVEEEESTLTLSRRFGVAPISVNRALRDMGISIRTKRSAGDKRRVALGKQANTKLSVHESALLLALHGRGLQPVPHLAVERFNVDLGFPDARLAVEIDGGNWHASPRKQAQDEAKESYLLAHGWRVIRFATTRSGWTDHAAQTVAAALAASTIGS